MSEIMGELNLDTMFEQKRAKRIGIFDQRLLMQMVSKMADFSQIELVRVEHQDGDFALAVREYREEEPIPDTWLTLAPRVEVDDAA